MGGVHDCDRFRMIQGWKAEAAGRWSVGGRRENQEVRMKADGIVKPQNITLG